MTTQAATHPSSRLLYKQKAPHIDGFDCGGESFHNTTSSLARDDEHRGTGTLKPQLLALPPELRNNIYKYVLIEPGHIDVPKMSTYWKRCGTTLLSTCTQIRKEAGAIYYGANTFRLGFHGDEEYEQLAFTWASAMGPRQCDLLKHVEVYYYWASETESDERELRASRRDAWEEMIDESTGREYHFTKHAGEHLRGLYGYGVRYEATMVVNAFEHQDERMTMERNMAGSYKYWDERVLQDLLQMQ